MTELFPGNNLSAYFKSENILNWKDPQGWSSQAPDPAQDHPKSHTMNLTALPKHGKQLLIIIITNDNLKIELQSCTSKRRPKKWKIILPAAEILCSFNELQLRAAENLAKTSRTRA